MCESVCTCVPSAGSGDAGGGDGEGGEGEGGEGGGEEGGGGGGGGGGGDGGDGGDGEGDQEIEGDGNDEDKETKVMVAFLDLLNDGFWQLYVLRCSNPAISPVINPGNPLVM